MQQHRPTLLQMLQPPAIELLPVMITLVLLLLLLLLGPALAVTLILLVQALLTIVYM
jgi:hypothetical protein